MNREKAIEIIDGVVKSDYMGTRGFVGSGEALNEVSEWLKSSEVSITTTNNNELVPFVQVEMTEEEIGQVVDQVIEVQVLKNRINELEAALSHLYECHSYGGEVGEDEHKKASREALRVLTNKQLRLVSIDQPLPNPHEENDMWWWVTDEIFDKAYIHYKNTEVGWLYMTWPVNANHIDAMINAWNAIEIKKQTERAGNESQPIR